MLAVDTHVLVRLITHDDPKQALRAQQALDAALLAFPGLRFEAMPVLLTAAKAWQSQGGDFADHLIGAQMQSLGCEAVLTFDKRVSKAGTHRAV
jgi:predicted nucleic-acid-binding protein